MKRLAGHELEDLLQVSERTGVRGTILTAMPQCIIPCIEGLFPEPHNTSVIELLFIFATWHALAKLHTHTDTSLRLLDTATTALGNTLRYFARVTCPEFNTFETSTKYTKHQHQQAATVSSTLNTEPSSTSRQPQTFSLQTIKLHFLSDYVSCIKTFGTTDNYNSALISKVPNSLFSQLKLITVRGKTAITGLNSIPSQDATTRRLHSSLARWITLMFRSAALQTIFEGLVFLFPVIFPHLLPLVNHSKRPNSLSPKVTSQRSIFHTGYRIIVMILW